MTKTFLITGANSGIGLATTNALAASGHHVILACRDLDRAHGAIHGIHQQLPQASLSPLQLDLASLASIKAAVAQIAALGPIHTLINNAGIMAPPYALTEDGFETQFGTNHLGHFALTGLLLPTLQATIDSRIVIVASQAHRWGRMHWQDLQATQSYRRHQRYAMSKLANLLFTHELVARLAKHQQQPLVVAAHPGMAGTALGKELGWPWDTLAPGLRGMLPNPTKGARATVLAATDSTARAGNYYGPTGVFGLLGKPGMVRTSAAGRNADDAHRLWELSIELTGIDPGI